MDHDLKIMCLQAISLGIFGMMGSVIVMLIVKAVRRYKEGDHAELELFDAMGKFIYFINDDDIDREILTRMTGTNLSHSFMKSPKTTERDSSSRPLPAGNSILKRSEKNGS